MRLRPKIPAIQALVESALVFLGIFRRIDFVPTQFDYSRISSSASIIRYAHRSELTLADSKGEMSLLKNFTLVYIPY